MSTLKEHQEVLLELLTEFDRVCRKNNIKYMLFAGSSLGAVRHQGFIPWDDDLDVALLREDYDRLMKLDPTEWNEAYYMQCEYSEHWPLHFSKLRKNSTTCLEKYHPKDNQIHQGIYIDVFPIDNASDNALIRKIQFYASKIVQARSFWQRGYDTDSIIKKTVMVLSNIMPKQTSDICHLFFEGKIKEACDIQLQLLPLIDALFCEVNPIPVKAACAAMGFCENFLRLPLTKMESKNEEKLLALMREQKLI